MLLLNYLLHFLDVFNILIQLLGFQLKLRLFLSFHYYIMISQGEVLAIFGVLNGMIGGTILVLPLLGLDTGYAFIPCVTILYGAISYYTCYLIVLHIGSTKNIKQVILQHFSNNKIALSIYSFIIAISLAGVILNYFQLIIKQIQGFVPQSYWISIASFLILFALTITMRFFNFGERLLAIGILSVLLYVGFLVWAQVSAPSGPKVMNPTGPKYIDLAASLIMGYSVHDFVTQVLLKTTTKDKFFKVVTIVYILGTLIYTFISYGAYAILNRDPRVKQPETISEYFPFEGWQVRIIEFIYLFHLLTATPEFCIIMRARFLQMVNLDEGEEITIPQYAFYFIFYLLCLVCYISKVKISTIIELNGSVIGFFYVFLIPIVIHIKCVYFSKHDEKGQLVYEEVKQDGSVVILEGKCKCKVEYPNKITKVLDLVLQVFIILLGTFTIYYTLKNLFKGTEADDNNQL